MALLAPIPVTAEPATGSASVIAVPCFGFTGSLPIRMAAESQIKYVVPGNARTSLTVFDIEGHIVARLVEGVDLTGAQTAHWSGLDSAGKRISNGVYFIRLEAGEYTDIRKVVVIQ
jgi:hypothetical protein